MHRFYVANPITGQTALISDAEQIHHMRAVLRLQTGREVTVFDGEGNEYLGTISLISKSQVVLALKSRKPAPPNKLKLTIACALPKQAGMDEIVTKLTQLGVDTLIPLETERVISRLKAKQDISQNEGRLERWRKISRNAAEQSRRNSLPDITRVMSLPEVLAQSLDYELKLIPTLAVEGKTLKEILVGSNPTSIMALIGPEGDFTPEEVDQALKNGFIAVSLGDTVLRVDTAAIALASYLKFALQD